MDVPRLEHVRVNVSDFGRAVSWYETVLGLPAHGHWPPDAPKYAHFQTGSTQFAISEMDPVPAAGRYNFSVQDVDAWWESLRDRAEVIEALFDTPYAHASSRCVIQTGTSSGSFARTDDLPGWRTLVCAVDAAARPVTGNDAGLRECAGMSLSYAVNGLPPDGLHADAVYEPSKRRNTIDALCPPKPDEFETATPTSASRASFGM
jgi:hypothetical protein